MTATIETLQAIVDTDDDQVFALDRDGRYLAFNRAHALAMRALYEVEVAPGDRQTDHAITAADREAALACHARALAGESFVVESVLGENGRRRTYELSHTPLEHAGGGVGRFVVRVRDVTAVRHSEEEIRRLNAELEARVFSRTEQRDAATRELEAFAYSVAHDVRAPLRSIDGFSALVLEDDGPQLSAGSREHLQRAREAAQRMARLLDDLLGLSRISRRELSRSRVDLSALAHEVAAELQTEHPGRRVHMTVADGMTVDADATLTRVIVRELLANAWKFTRHHPDAHVEVGSTGLDGDRVFFVRDDGAGFDMRAAQHLFGVFQRMHTADQFEGDGVGLATVQRLVLRHGGRVWAEAETEKGATFCFTLPEPAASA